jgi:hypothetical protein
VSWLLKGMYESAEQLRRVVHQSRSGAGVIYVSAALPLDVGDAFVLETKLVTSGFQRWTHGVVQARGTGVLKLQVEDVRQLLRPEREQVVLARRSPRFWAGLEVQVSGPGLPASAGVLQELSADGARVLGDVGPLIREVDLSLPVGNTKIPLARARICWRTPTHAGLELVERLDGEVALSRLLRLLAVRWDDAIRLLAPGEEASGPLPGRPPPLDTLLARELLPQVREQSPQSGSAAEPVGVRADRFVPET